MLADAILVQTDNFVSENSAYYCFLKSGIGYIDSRCCDCYNTKQEGQGRLYSEDIRVKCPFWFLERITWKRKREIRRMQYE